MITFQEYLELVYKNIAKYPNFRYGQILYNTLQDIDYERALSIVGKDIDPYYTNDTDVTGAFLAYLIRVMPSPAESGPRSSKPSAEGSTPSEGAK